MPRTVKEWIGRTPDSMPPPKVRQRILERANFFCHICGGQIDKPGWHADHVPPLKDGGENREFKIKPAHDVCHRRETARQAIERAPIERKKLKASGAVRPKQSIKSAGFGLSAHASKREARAKDALPALLPKQLFERTVR